MKKGILLGVILATALSFGQNTFPASGNVGIGIVSPEAALHIEKNGVLLKLANNLTNFAYSGIDGLGLYLEQVADTPNKSQIRLQTRNSNSGNYSQFFIDGANSRFNFINGNVGIGTITPSEKLDVMGNVKLSNYSPTLVLQRNTNIGGFTQGIQTKLQDGTDNWYFGNLHSGSWIVSKGDYQNAKMTVLENGNVGIGTTAPDTKLAVNGTIHTKEVKVDLLSPMVPDYVFTSDYKLKTLQEVEAYINKNSHLPEIPSAKELEKNGLMLAEMNMSLLKKMEEMTLYMIEQDKQLKKQNVNFEKQNSQLQLQNEKILTLEKKIEKIESALK